MKIDINLSEIFEDGNEEGEIDAPIKDLIIDTVTQRIYNKLDKDISAKISDILQKGITERMNAYLSNLIPMLMEYEFEETAKYGCAKEKITVKNRILKELETQCIFKDKGYSSDNTAFTNTLKNIVEAQMKIYKPMFDKEINALFVKEAMEYAQKSLQTKLGIKP